jgi:glucose/arabinose dehydrogenase
LGSPVDARAAHTSCAFAHARLGLLCLAIAASGLLGCSQFGGENGGDPKVQIGANPILPEPQQYLLPPMHIAKVVGWAKGETRSVPQGLQIRALATGLAHPRSLNVLPNGDVLVVETSGPGEPVHRPKNLIMGWVQSYAGARAKGGNRITLLRDIGPDGVAKTRTVFLDKLHSPFGVALVGHNLYVANTDALMRYPYEDGQTSITAAGVKLTDCPAGRLTITGRKRWWRAPTGRSFMSASAPTATSPRTGWRLNASAPPFGRSTE